ncbi:MAG: hypothetical protein OXC79_09850 [Candidatus Poribacteria bacterium]|nr:hypothetical protein [Candidatus Poribacteria bacterium]
MKVGNQKSAQWLQFIYESAIQSEDIDDVIQELFERERKIRRANEQQLINELYKIQSFDWGGLHQNSLETTIVNRYVKQITSYESLHKEIEGNLHKSLRAYVVASWYNHWSSIIIEDIFKEHDNVIPAIGQIKKIDFFVNNKPFDLKVTYLPEGYIKDQRKSHGFRPELTLMKGLARKLDIGFDKSVPDSILVPDLWRKLDDNPQRSAKELISELQEYRETLLDECIANPKPLVQWLYENQGTRRFDASNRLFLVLVDKIDFFSSWKLKRARPLISEHVTNYLTGVNQGTGFQLDFDWEDETYSTEADIIFVVKE